MDYVLNAVSTQFLYFLLLLTSIIDAVVM